MIVFSYMNKIDFNNTTGPEQKEKWTAFLNGETDISDIQDMDAKDKSDLTSAWEATGTAFSYSAADPDKAWSTLLQKIHKPEINPAIRFLNSRVLQVAAMIVIAMGIGFSVYRVIWISDKKIIQPVKMLVTQTEAHPLNFTIITLTDGSTVKMNASTRIEYPEKFTANVRKIKLSGEAFFEVTRDTLHPFIVETAKASVEVLGTSFNVSAYPMATLVEVNVRSGKVKLTPIGEGKSSHKSAVLPAGQHGWLRLADDNLGHENRLAPNYSSWITKEIIFQRTPLSEAFSILENTYHVKFIIKNPEIGKIPYTANFADLNLDYIIEVIARTHKLSVTRDGDKIIFARKVY